MWGEGEGVTEGVWGEGVWVRVCGMKVSEGECEGVWGRCESEVVMVIEAG